MIVYYKASIYKIRKRVDLAMKSRQHSWTLKGAQAPQALSAPSMGVSRATVCLYNEAERA